MAEIKYSYLVAAAGVALMAITAVSGEVREILIRETLRKGFGGNHQFGNANPFGLRGSLTILAVIIAIVGLIWSGVALSKSHKSATN